MITFEEAYRIVLDHVQDFGTSDVPLLSSSGRVLRESWNADRDFPPFDRVMMDGIAIHYDDTFSPSSQFPIEGVAAAGDSEMELKSKSNCIEVMTGAVLPIGTDTVIRYEDVIIEQGIATIRLDVHKGQNIHLKGNDKNKNDLLLEQGKVLNSADVGIAASIGKTNVKVSNSPKTLIVSTGNELVNINQTPLPHQIRMSNVFQIASVLNDSFKIKANQLHLSDNQRVIKEKLESEININDLIILSGGVSKGKFDFIPEALQSLGVKKLFHRVQQRPGKPFWFGVHPNGCTVFALPGNPISSFMCTQIYLKSWIEKSLQSERRENSFAQLTEDVFFKPNLTYFMEVKLNINSKGQVLAKPQKGNGSGDLANLSRANAFLRLPQGRDVFEKGEILPYHQFSTI